MIDKTLAKQAAKSSGKHNIVHQFLSYAFHAYDLNIAQDGAMVHPVELPAGKVQIAVIIYQDTGIEHVKNSWWKILKWRKALAEFQGTEEDDASLFYKELSEAHNQGISYNKLAREVNRNIAELLEEYVKYLEDYNEALRQYEDDGAVLGLAEGFFQWLDNYREQYRNRLPAFKHADDLLKYCKPKLNEDQRNKILNSGLKRIQQGERPFLPGEPVSGERDVRERIRYWRKKKGMENTG